MNEPFRLERQRRLGEIISDSFGVFFGQWGRLVAIMLPAGLVNLAVSLLQLLVEDNRGLYTLLALVSLPVIYVAYGLVAAGVVVALRELGQGRLLAVGDALDAAEARAGDLIAGLLRSAAIIFAFALTIVGLPWAVMRLVRWAFIVQVIMLEGQAGEPSLAQSARLVQGRWWSTFGRLVATGLVVGLPALLVMSVVQASLSDLAAAFATAAIGAAVSPFGVVATTLIYFDLRLARGVREAAEPA